MAFRLWPIKLAPNHHHINVLIFTVTLLAALCPCPVSAMSGQQNNPNQEQPVDELIKDTMLLLDSLDQKVSSITNKTRSLLRKQRDTSPLGEPPLSLPSQVKAAQDSDPEEGINVEPTFSLDSPEEALTLAKQARQLDQSSSASSDSTERHIKFTLDLMQAMFASNSYNSKSQSIESFLISPLSIQMVLMMMHLGARGQTRREISNCLHLTPQNSLDIDADQPIGSLDASPFHLSSSSSPSKPKRRTGLQPEASSSKITSAWLKAHDAFGSAIKNLLKDSSVTKALTNANQIFLQKTLTLSSQYEWAFKHYYGSDVQLVDFQNPNTTTTANSQNSQPTRHQTAEIDTTQVNSTTTSSQKPPSESSKDVQKIINDWVERHSKGKINNFITSPIPTSTLMIAINVLYFKGDWQYKFDPADTEPDSPFTMANGKTIQVPMMVSRLPLAYAHNAAMKTSVVELPYKAQRLGLFILLPDDVAGIFNTISMLNSTSFASLISSMRKVTPSTDQGSNGLNVRIPKFGIESTPRLSSILSQHLGLKTLFSPDVADLSGMFSPVKKRANTSGNNKQQSSLNANDKDGTSAGDPSVSIQAGLDELVHKAILQVDEYGSVAAATSATIVERVGLFNNNYFEADHPFLLFLMDKQTGLVLFSGVYAGPNNAKQENVNVPTAGNSTNSESNQTRYHHH